LSNVTPENRTDHICLSSKHNLAVMTTSISTALTHHNVHL